MASYLSLVLLAVAFSVTISSARVIPAEPVTFMLDAYGNPVLFLREKRAPLTRPLIPHRSMMFTGYYRPARRSYAGDQAAGVFAQGNAVSGGSYLGGVPHLKNGPSPIDEPEISSAQAEASPEPENIYPAYEQEDQRQVHEENTDSAAQPEEQPEAPISGPEPRPYDIEGPIAPETVAETDDRPADGDSGSVLPARPTPPVKKGKKTPIFEQDEEDDEDLDEEDEHVPVSTGNGNRRRGGGNVPNLNNFFPMMFSFPGFSRRGGSASGSPPGIVTAIANSYSTGKGGVASSVATAYGGSPNGKKARRAPAITAEK